MARRRRSSHNDSQIIFGLLVSIGVLWVAVQLLASRVFLEGTGIFLLILVGIPIAVVLIRQHQQKQSRHELLEKSEAIVDSKIAALMRSKAQLIRQDAYGIWQLEKWEKEKSRFIAQLIEPSLSLQECRALRRDHTVIRNMIEARVDAARQELPVFRKFSDDMTPSEFEEFCADELRQAGWNARVTMQSRDQGTDVVAEKNGVRVVLQCKLYAGSVGNKSVQEISAGKIHEQANYGIVVTNSRFTAAAQQLASTNKVLLLHYCDLRNLENLLS